ncbi:MAG: hypothetical protein E6J62_03540 [Deltaproteobacteria bacterium]|nr:MAG: hypothetical protein E6J62_03540 [Deltaproteobacteria bacterium]
MNLAILALSTSVLFAQAPSQADDDLAEQVRLAKRDVDSGEYAKASQRLAQLVEAGHFQSQDLRSEAYRLLGISLILQQPPRPEEAKNAFREVLLVDPDTELDPFYVPQRVVDFFDQEKKELEPQLAPIRAQKRAERDVRRKQLEAEAAKRREEEQQRRIRSLQPNVERRVIQREFWVSLLPFGLGQLQNGDRSLGYTLATLQVAFGAASAGSALLIEGLRDNTTQKFGQTEYRIATKLEIVKWVGAAAFYGLWAGGAVDAAIHFKPETQLQDKLLVPPAPGAPTGSLHPEERRAPRHAKAEPITASYEGAP